MFTVDRKQEVEPDGILSVHELRVALGTGDDHIHPDPHGFCRRRHHEVEPVMGLHAKRQRRVWALRTQTKMSVLFTQYESL